MSASAVSLTRYIWYSWLTLVALSVALPGGRADDEDGRIVVIDERIPGTDPETTDVENLPMEGNWFIEWLDTPNQGERVKGAFQLNRSWERVAVPMTNGTKWQVFPNTNVAWYFNGYTGDNLERHYYPSGTRDINFINDAMHIKHPYNFLGGGTSVVSLLNADQLQGNWKNGEKAGREIWRRAKAKPTRIRFTFTRRGDSTNEVAYGTPGRVEGVHDPYWWGTGIAAGNRPEFNIDVYGENFWGHHVASLGEEVDLEIVGERAISDKNAVDKPYRIIGYRIGVRVWPSYSPGRKILELDEFKIPFDFVVSRRIPDMSL